MKTEKNDEKKIIEFYNWLRRETPTIGNTKIKGPNLSDKKAFEIFYVLQEFLRVIPDTFETCHRCHELFDMDKEGIHVSEDDIKDDERLKKIDVDKNYCDFCFDRVIYYQDRRL